MKLDVPATIDLEKIIEQETKANPGKINATQF
jgi:hypothetical protein